MSTFSWLAWRSASFNKVTDDIFHFCFDAAPDEGRYRQSPPGILRWHV